MAPRRKKNWKPWVSPSAFIDIVTTVKYLGKLRELASVAEENINQSRVQALLVELSNGNRTELRELLFVDGDRSELNDDVEVLVNGRNIKFLDGMATSLGREDRVTLLYHGVRGFPGG